jgi:hypothetical protein
MDVAWATRPALQGIERPLQGSADQPSVGRMVKVFGCRPSQVEREAWGRRTETAQARTRGAQVRRYGDLKILVWPYG